MLLATSISALSCTFSSPLAVILAVSRLVICFYTESPRLGEPLGLIWLLRSPNLPFSLCALPLALCLPAALGHCLLSAAPSFVLLVVPRSRLRSPDLAL